MLKPYAFCIGNMLLQDALFGIICNFPVEDLQSGDQHRGRIFIKLYFVRRNNINAFIPAKEQVAGGIDETGPGIYLAR